ncbi:glycogen-binding domain-containing protein [Thermodesulfobacteriota bacterium]
MSDSISMFIDNELDLDGKITFVKKIHNEDPFYNESIVLLEQEKQLRSDVVPLVPDVSFKKASKFSDTQYFNLFFRIAKAGVVTAVLILLVFSLYWKNDNAVPDAAPGPVSKRFVIFQPEASNVQIAGSFTNWNNIPLKMVGPGGYWEIELDVARGEHKYVFIVGDDKKITDPTILMKEEDDFGSENSVLVVEA